MVFSKEEQNLWFCSFFLLNAFFRASEELKSDKELEISPIKLIMANLTTQAPDQISLLLKPDVAKRVIN